MEILRTPDERFAALPGWSYAPRYVEASGLRVHYVDEGPRDAPVVLMLHGEPTWAYLYRRMIAGVAAAGLRAVALDLVGFGRSDKPAARTDYSYARHLAWTRAAVAAIGLHDVTLFCQDWGGLIGLRLVAAEPERYARVVASNTFLPTGREPVGEAFLRWRQFSQEVPEFGVGAIVRRGCARPVADEVVAAYDAPFPEERMKAGARQFPTLVPISTEDPAAGPNAAAWGVLTAWTKPFLTLFGDSDPITRGADRFLQAAIPGARGQPHATIARAGHFIQEDAGEEVADAVVRFVRAG